MSERAAIAAKNTLYNYLAYGWRAILSLLVTPYIIVHLANDAYGVFMLALLIINYLEYLYLGLGDSVTKNLSACTDPDRRNRIINSTFFVFIVMGLVTGASLVLFTRFTLLGTFKIPDQIAAGAQFVFYVLAASFAVNLPLSTFASALRGLQRLDLLNRVLILQATVSSAAMLIALSLGWGLEGLILAYAAFNAIGFTANIGLLKRVFPDFRLSWRWFDRSEIRTLIRYAVPSTIGGLSFLVIFQCNVPMLSMYLPVGIVTYYIVANQLASQIWLIASLVYGAMFPLVSQLHSEDNLDGVRELYTSSTILILSVTLPVAVTLFAFADRIFLFWLAGDYQLAVLPLRILSVAWLISTLGTASSFTSRGIGRPRIDATLAVTMALATIGLNVIAIPTLGIAGALAVAVAVQLVGSAVNIWLVTRIIRLESRANYLSRVSKVLLVGLFPAVVLIPSWPSLPLTVTQGLLYLGGYGWVLWRYCWSQSEKSVLHSLLPHRLGAWLNPRRPTTPESQ
ncbi:MAG TPA: oligosaccharide flippase family protein [Acidobacteriota bacterium]|nr:oligosaccharide flippase family protein [Acidobacteriota bacterium]HQF87511.1 oligosaccharide flippase family protein [Acidobacteriota bacterium]HQG92703.1 oligosaccharide flippase family protein [Acidobacteriota bacterium]